jgi:hypothetical protein
MIRPARIPFVPSKRIAHGNFAPVVGNGNHYSLSLSLSLSIYIYIYIHLCARVCVYVCVRARARMSMYTSRWCIERYPLEIERNCARIRGHIAFYIVISLGIIASSFSVIGILRALECEALRIYLRGSWAVVRPPPAFIGYSGSN